MRCSDRVHAKAFKRSKLSLYRVSVHSSAESSEVVVHTYAVELQLSSVEQKSFVRVELGGAEAEHVCDGIENILSVQNLADHFI